MSAYDRMIHAVLVAWAAHQKAKRARRMVSASRPVCPAYELLRKETAHG